VALQPMATTVFDSINTALIATMKGLTAFMESPVLPEIGKAFGVYFGLMATSITDAWKIVEPIFAILIDTIKVVSDLLTGNWQGAWNAAGAVVSNFGKLLIAVPKAIYDNIMGPFIGALGLIGGFPGRVGAALGALPAVVVGAFTSAFGAVAAGVEGALGGLWSVVGGIPNRVKNGIGDAYHILYNAGADVVRGFIDGIGSLAGAVTAKIESVIKAPINAAKSLLHLGSPSKLFVGFGRDTMQGYINGLTSMQSAVGKAMNVALPTDLPTLTGGTTAAGARGPAVVIQHADFHDEADLEALLRKAAFATTAGVL
jgi:phage-related protein